MKIALTKDFYEDNGVTQGIVLFTGLGDLNSDGDTVVQDVFPFNDATPAMKPFYDEMVLELTSALGGSILVIEMQNLEVKETSPFAGWSNGVDGIKEAMKDIMQWTKPPVFCLCE